MKPVETVAAELRPEAVAQLSAPHVAHPKLRLVPHVAQKKEKRTRATRGTKTIRPKSGNGLEPPAMEGFEWRPAGSGFNLWRRVPSVSANGKRSSKRTYIKYYSRQAVKKLYEKENRINTRPA